MTIETETIRGSWEKGREKLENALFSSIRIPEKPPESDQKAFQQYRVALRAERKQKIQQRFILLMSMANEGMNPLLAFGLGRRLVVSFGQNPERMKKLYAWLLTGDPDYNEPLEKISYAGGMLDRLWRGGGCDEHAYEEDLEFFDRTSTHEIQDDIEVQSGMIGAKNYLQGRSKDTDKKIFEENSGNRTLNYGVDFGLGAGLVGIEQESDNCYMFVGIENSSPGKKGHGMGGKNKKSFLGTQKTGDDLYSPEEYFGEKVPTNLNEVKIKCDTDEGYDALIKKLTETQINKKWYRSVTKFGFDGENLRPETIQAWEAVGKLKCSLEKKGELSNYDKEYLEGLQKEIKINS